MMNKGLLLPIAAPSGTGKTTVCNELMKIDERFVFSVSCTTRKMRKGEADGVNYHFVDEAAFKQFIKEDKLAEWEQVFDNYYGTLKSTLEQGVADGKIILLDIDVKGALNLKQQYPEDTLAIFLKPPSIEELLRRLKGRGTEKEDEINLRNARIADEMEYGKQFDIQITNDILEKTVNEIYELIKKRN